MRFLQGGGGGGGVFWYKVNIAKVSLETNFDSDRSDVWREQTCKQTGGHDVLRLFAGMQMYKHA